MQDQPTPAELIGAVADFLRSDIAPQLSGHAAFKLRVGLNALDLVVRQLGREAQGDAAEIARLSELLGTSGSLEGLNRQLSERIATGAMDLTTPRPQGSSVADHDGQACGRSAQLCELSARA